ncbi:transient receptor potential cation channel subfamily V member 1-like isoform X1 [Alosa sapidissima]|uniref:transient receptor potential cation channel subfamily V member 1-like isoform X1 n=1 Tax=Alosa sapidissima TaxID=34773 RepID=UPI001C08AAD1|nr:transient receptor potential cation channel subfamily V member 1-like isoform X1 [Alosa sapidissima]XP_041947099.1 transient receptor potential cation channel subfamily V member 1-like isoform X1 [Alosa sapidissima]
MATNPQTFMLESDDRSKEEINADEERKIAEKKRNLLDCALGKSGKDKGPMDTSHVEDEGAPDIEIRLNVSYILGTEPGESFRQILFDAVASRDVNRLNEIQEHLEKYGKKLSDSLYRLFGKTPLVKALLNLKNGENDTVKYLLDIAENMGDLKPFVNAAYTGSYYSGQTALHVAIERRSRYFVELLVQKGADVHAKACGKFFQLHDGPCFYFGELPLSLAACTNQKDIVDFLLENQYQKANVCETDSQGNMVLHALVVVADNSPKNTDFIIKMYDHILTKAAQLHPKTKLEEIENKQHLTPIKLAAKTGKIELLKHMMHREIQGQESTRLSRKFIEWAYGPVSGSLYDLESLDSYGQNSVLEIIVYGSEIPNRLEMLQVEPLNKLLDEKWDRFAHRIFLFKFLMYLLYVFIFTCVAYFGNKKMSTEARVLYAAGQQISFWGSLYLFCRELLDIKRRCPNLQSLLIDGYFELIFFLQALLCIISFVLYWCGKAEHLGFLVLSLALSWLNLLYFSRGFRHMGIYSVMIQKILLGDILRFLLVYIVFLFGFSAAVVTLMDAPKDHSNTTSASSNQTFQSNINQTAIKHQPDSDSGDSDKPTFNNFYFTALELFKFTIGMGDLEFTEQYRYKEVFYVLLISYIVLTYILLLNMLIALMSQTVQELTEESMSIWKLQRAITILDMERVLPQCLRRRLRSGIERDLGGSAGDNRRWCLRVEESQVKDWENFNNEQDTICEDPGRQKPAPRPEKVAGEEHAESPVKKKSWSLLRTRFRARVFSNSDHEQMSPQSPDQA